MRFRLIVLLVALMGLFVAGCEHPENEADQRERKAQGTNYTNLQAKQPAQSMDYSPTREGLNKWMETWEEPGKTSYVYLLTAEGQIFGYYVFEGLPVSYCASLTPPDRRDEDRNYSDQDLLMQAPSMDGVYYSGSQCNQFFGYDATTGSYIEFSAGNGLNFFVTEQPLPVESAKPLGYTTIEEAEKQK